MNEQPKFCKDCKHAFGWPVSELRCSKSPHADAVALHLVTGQMVDTGYYFCKVERGYESGPCGAEGKLWEPKDQAQ